MKIQRIIILLSLFFIFGCNSILNTDIQRVKKSEVKLGYGSNYTINDLVNKIAGVRGAAEWTSFKSDEYANSSEIVCVQVNITRNKTKDNLVIIQYLLNRNSGVVETGHISIDGVTKSKLDFGIFLMGVELENLL